MSTPPFPLVLDGFPRCGSTTLARVLSVNPEINCCMEPFHPRRYGGVFNRVASQAGSVEPALRLLKARWNALKHVWEPGLAWPFTGRQDLNDDLLRHASCIISLRRRNLLQQIVSGFISKHVRLWIGTKIEFQSSLDSAYLPPLSIADAKEALMRAFMALEEREKLLKTLPAKQLTFYYEDYFNADFERQCDYINRLFVHLGYTGMAEAQLRGAIEPFMNRQTYKWASESVYERIPGIHLVDEQLGNETTGRIFS